MNAREEFSERYWRARCLALDVLELALLDPESVTRLQLDAAKHLSSLAGAPQAPVDPPSTTESRLEAALRALLDEPVTPQ